MKKKLLVLAALAAGSVLAQTRFSIGVGVGSYGPAYGPAPAYGYAAPAYAYAAPPCPGPGFYWVDGYWARNGWRNAWVPGYWARRVYERPTYFRRDYGRDSERYERFDRDRYRDRDNYRRGYGNGFRR